jgi:two-component system chemotaxis sensor kinase CheA
LPTAGNADIFKQSFREEAREILVDLESALLELNENPGDLELVGRVFRGLHTIKGSGAMFGFEDLAAFTHNLETAFDEVRNGRLLINAELVDLTLSALDQIRAMLEESAEGAVDPEACAEILARVRHLTGKPEKKVAKAAVAEASQEKAQAAAQGPLREWAIRFAPGPEFMLNGTNPLLLLKELRQLGGLAVRASLAELPPLKELDPERCYIRWEMVLATAADQDAIRDVFIFVEDNCELTIEPAENPVEPAMGQAGEAAAAAKPTAGQTAPARPLSEAERTARALEDKRAQRGGRRDYDAPDNTTSLRVPAAKLDQFVDLVGELVTVQARLSELAARRDDAEVASVAEEIERLTSSLRENSMTIRMMPIRATFEKFRRLVHDLARDLGKQVELTIEGAETELDKTVIDQLSDPLMHLIRNSMDHGIESPKLRAERGKPATATIHLSARHSGASVLIGVSDDGGGINAEAVRNRAIERGLTTENAQLSEQEIFSFIFQPGFSTAKQVTDVSGRGVGMDVVRQRVESLRGTIDIASTPGAGTGVTLRLPLTLAIIDGLLVSVGEAYFVLPLANILECIELTEEDIAKSNGKHVAIVRGEVVPYIRLRQHFNIHTARPSIEQIMIVETEGGRYGFVVDKVLGDCQTVIKNLGRFYRHVQVVSGATILGDGTVALILDPERLATDAVRALSVGTRGIGAAGTGRRAVAGLAAAARLGQGQGNLTQTNPGQVNQGQAQAN